MSENKNYDFWQSEIEWVKRCILFRINENNNQESLYDSFQAIPVPKINNENEYGKFIIGNNLQIEERFLLATCIAPHLDASIFNDFYSNTNPAHLIYENKGDYLLPSGATFLFVVAGNDLIKRMNLLHMFQAKHLFHQKGMIDFGQVVEGNFAYSGVLKINPSFLDLFLFNEYRPPRYSHDFPAHLLQTSMEWEDLILNPSAQQKVDDIKAWLYYKEKLCTEWHLEKHMKKGYKALFHGPSGTGKTLTATLLGKHFNKDVYRVDLSNIISKYIGETSKNLEKLFNTAEDKNWILFFDEGDALFGKRTDNSKNDKNTHFANQDIAYLLQRIEDYNGLVLLATNLKGNMDEAFIRRFQSIIPFHEPTPENRMKIWKTGLPEQNKLTDENIQFLAQKYPMTAASIFSVINYASLQAVKNKKDALDDSLIQTAIKEEIKKYR